MQLTDRQEQERARSQKGLAKKLGFIYVDTGAMYRAMAYYFLQHNIDAKDENAIAAACPDVDVTITYENGEQQVLLNGENVNGVIRTEEVGNMASATSVYPVVRKKLVELQRQLAKSADVIMDGRDIGTCVLPDAQVKIYLTASSATRAKSRYDELTEKGVSCDLAEIEKILLTVITVTCIVKHHRFVRQRMLFWLTVRNEY